VVPSAKDPVCRPWAAERIQPIAQFLAAFPANVLFPIAVVGIVTFRLDPNIWLSPLMIWARNGTSCSM
jgi:NitT/TauT family transport system permease protein